MIANAGWILQAIPVDVFILAVCAGIGWFVWWAWLK
jgi:hypothetical protein